MDVKPCKYFCTSAPIPPTSPSGEATQGAPVSQQLGMFDVFKIGIGPSSSHTVGPMAAAARFVKEIRKESLFDLIEEVRCDLYGSLALTGTGHGTDKAVCVGLAGQLPSTVDPDEADEIFVRACKDETLKLGNEKAIIFDYEDHMIFHYDEELPEHPNGMKLTAIGEDGAELYSNKYLSLGGGFIKSVSEYAGNAGSNEEERKDVPYPFRSASELLKICGKFKLTIAEVMIENEKVLTCDGDYNEVCRRLDELVRIFMECIERGKTMTGVLPVSGIKRQSNDIYNQLTSENQKSLCDHFAVMDWVTLFARCVNEENACGGRIVTSPTNGASGTLPAVLGYYINFCQSSPEGCRNFLATAAAFGTLLKTNASISGAEAGCQAEVGSACAMAAAALTAVKGGTLLQIENSAEIALEHNLGMTCDPIGGLVQVPCIERNCVAAVKAITSHRLSMRGNGRHEVSFDSCVRTMYKTGLDMQAKYRETSTGGLAIHARRPSHYVAVDAAKCKEVDLDGESTTASIRHPEEAVC